MCFMKIKSRLAPLDCPEKYWTRTTEMKQPEDLPPEIVEEVLKLWEEIKGGRAKTQKDKKKRKSRHQTKADESDDTLAYSEVDSRKPKKGARKVMI